MTDLKPKLILVPTDFSETASHALKYASALAARIDAQLLIMHADHFVPPFDFVSRGAFDVSRETMIAEAQERLLRHVESSVDARVPYDTRIVVAAPTDAILDTTREIGAQLIVMGTHGRSGVARLIVGSVTETVMRNATVPVIAVNERTYDHGRIAKILCPVTTTAATVDALRHAAALVNGRSTPIVLVSAIESPGDAKSCTDELLRLRDWLPRQLIDRCELMLVNAPLSAEAILEIASAKHPDLIVLGMHAHRTAAEVLRGATAERVMQQSHCPVLTVAVLSTPSVRPRQDAAAVY